MVLLFVIIGCDLLCCLFVFVVLVVWYILFVGVVGWVVSVGLVECWLVYCFVYVVVGRCRVVLIVEVFILVVGLISGVWFVVVFLFFLCGFSSFVWLFVLVMFVVRYMVGCCKWGLLVGDKCFLGEGSGLMWCYVWYDDWWCVRFWWLGLVWLVEWVMFFSGELVKIVGILVYLVDWFIVLVYVVVGGLFYFFW